MQNFGAGLYRGQRENPMITLAPTKMPYRSKSPVTIISLLLACFVLALAVSAQDQGVSSDPPLNDQQIRDLTLRVLNNQHQNDMVLEQYGRTEHEQLRGKGVTEKESVVSRDANRNRRSAH